MSFIKFSSCSPNQNQIEFDVRALPRSHKCTHFSYYLNSDAHMPKWLCHEEWEFHCRLWKTRSNTKEKKKKKHLLNDDDDEDRDDTEHRGKL